MPDPTFIPGALGTITIDTDPIITGTAANFNRSKGAMAKAIIGAPAAFALGGQVSGTFSVSGSVSVEQLPELETMFAKTVPVAFSIQLGDAAGATDGGLYAGFLVANNLNITVAGDGEWDYSFDALTTGLPVYTPPTP